MKAGFETDDKNTGCTKKTRYTLKHLSSAVKGAMPVDN